MIIEAKDWADAVKIATERNIKYRVIVKVGDSHASNRKEKAL